MTTAAQTSPLPILSPEDVTEICENADRVGWEEERLEKLLARIAEAQEDFELDDDDPMRIGIRANIGGPRDEIFGHRNVKPRSYKKKVPEWTRNMASIQELINTVFPKWRTNNNQHDSAGRWAAVINLHYRNGYTASQIAEEIGSSTLKIKCVMRSIQRAAKGLRADSNKPRTNSRGRNLRAGPQHPRSKKSKT